MPRIQPVQRSVEVGSQVDMRWMWNGRLTYTKDHAKVPKNIASGSMWVPRTSQAGVRVLRAGDDDSVVTKTPVGLGGGERLVAGPQSTATRLPPRRLASETDW
jgi:hypothetical protein